LRGLSLLSRLIPYAPKFTGGVTVAVGDTNGDGKPDIITGPGAGAAPLVKTISGADLTTVLQSFLAYSSKFLGGVFVAAGNLNDAIRADIVTAPGRGMPPEVKVFQGNNPSSVLQDFLAYEPLFLGGVTVAVKDVDGDGLADILTGPGPTAGAHVRIFRGLNPSVELRSFFAFDPSLLRGIYVG